ncbi:MAG: tRNA 2-thiouridine(34) synthase MnmA [Oscillospiraceae bacterium]|jgi:tRNA-specific 2-thiouridylase|nr:tRNA 2-thiouridine(34) synthase MnmA [Oscillospiraceae bacterium]
MPKALIAMSGGVDSSVAAYLMQQAGCECVGAMMKLYRGGTDEVPGRTCCSLADAQDARSVATRLGMPFYVFNYTADFESKVIERFCGEYLAGRTPNPCIDCNRFMKFELLLLRARLMGCNLLASGHYAQVEQSGSGRHLLRKALDSGKDQSYVLYMLTQEQLEAVRFPLGGMTKQQVRELAADLGFWNAEKPDSQDICFVPDGDYGTFLERRLALSDSVGHFVDSSGAALGGHRGHYRYTVGQRKGLGLAFDSPRYVLSKNPAANTVTLGKRDELLRCECVLEDINLIALDSIEQPMRISVRTRYRQKEQPGTVTQTAPGTLMIILDEPQVIAPGQAAVIYDGEYVVGGGTII